MWGFCVGICFYLKQTNTKMYFFFWSSKENRVEPGSTLMNLVSYTGEFSFVTSINLAWSWYIILLSNSPLFFIILHFSFVLVIYPQLLKYIYHPHLKLLVAYSNIFASLGFLAVACKNSGNPDKDRNIVTGKCNGFSLEVLSLSRVEGCLRGMFWRRLGRREWKLGGGREAKIMSNERRRS